MRVTGTISRSLASGKYSVTCPALKVSETEGRLSTFIAPGSMG